MDVKLKNLGKRFNNQWVFRHLNMELLQGHRYVILGSNGSGKSTLLQTMAGYRIPSEGGLSYQIRNTEVPADNQYRHLSIASPYLELIEEFNIDELMRFHFNLKPIRPEITFNDFLSLLQLQNISGKPIKLYSSGMKQRVRLALAFFSNTSALFLDEPCSNLDAQGVEWYRNLLDSYTKNRLVVICSNHQESEYFPCENPIDISDYKPKPSLKSRQV